MCYDMILTMVRYVFESCKLWCELNMDNWRILQKKRIDYDTEKKKNEVTFFHLEMEYVVDKVWVSCVVLLLLSFLFNQM